MGNTYGGTQGDNFQLNVVNNLDNTTMLTATTVVRLACFSVQSSKPDVITHIALAWILPERYQLCRRCGHDHPVPHFC